MLTDVIKHSFPAVRRFMSFKIPDIRSDAAGAMIVPQQETQQDINVNVFVVDRSHQKGDVTENIDYWEAVSSPY